MRLEAFSKRAHRLPQVGICVQFLALVRTLSPNSFGLSKSRDRRCALRPSPPTLMRDCSRRCRPWTGVLCYFAGTSNLNGAKRFTDHRRHQ